MTKTEKEINKEMSDFVKWFYEEVLHKKADKTAYIRSHKTIKDLLWSEDPEIQVYDPSTLYKTVERLIDHGCRFNDYTILMWPNLVRSVHEEDQTAFKIQADAIKSNVGIETDAWLEAERPDGW